MPPRGGAPGRRPSPSSANRPGRRPAAPARSARQRAAQLLADGDALPHPGEPEGGVAARPAARARRAGGPARPGRATGPAGTAPRRCRGPAAVGGARAPTPRRRPLRPVPGGEHPRTACCTRSSAGRCARRRCCPTDDPCDTSRAASGSSSRGAPRGPRRAWPRHRRRRHRAGAQPLTPAQVGEPGHRPAGEHLSPGAILPLTSTPSRSAPWATEPGRQLHPRPVEPGVRASAAPAGRRWRTRDPSTRRSDHRGGGRVVERLLQERHAALRLVDRPGVGDHRPLLGLAGAGDPGVPVGVVDPRHPGRAPAALDPLDRAVDRQHLEQQLEPGPPHVGDGLQPGRRPGLAVGHRGEHGGGVVLARHRRGGEPLPDRQVLGPGQQQHVGVLDGAAGAADLLVVADRGGRAPRWTTKPRSGLSNPMPSAEVATSALTRFSRRASSASLRSASSRRPV